MWETEQFWGTIDFHSIFFLLWKSMVLQNSLLQTLFKISSFIFGRTNKSIQVWNYLRVSKWWKSFHFWVNYPFKHYISLVQCKKNLTKERNENDQIWLYTWRMRYVWKQQLKCVHRLCLIKACMEIRAQKRVRVSLTEHLRNVENVWAAHKHSLRWNSTLVRSQQRSSHSLPLTSSIKHWHHVRKNLSDSD